MFNHLAVEEKLFIKMIGIQNIMKLVSSIKYLNNYLFLLVLRVLDKMID